MKILITESQLLTLHEISKEHAMDEIVDFKNIDLVYEYEKLNDLLFNGELPKKGGPIRIEFAWSKRKSAHGTTQSWVEKATGKIVKIVITVSKFFDVKYNLFRDVLVHEMIHVYQAVNRVVEPNGNHGPVFHREMNRINGMGLGFDVDIVVNVGKHGLVMSKDIKALDLVAVILNIDGETAVSVLTPNCYENDAKSLSDIFDYNTRKGKYKKVDAEIYKTKIPILRRFKVNKSIKNSLSWAKGLPEVPDLIRNEGTLINRFVSIDGQSQWDNPPKEDILKSLGLF
jgi:hypothetical protein